MISVIVCTWNRARVLKRCLQSLAEQTCPTEAYEVVVVDNNSTDDTLETANRFASECDVSVHYVRELRQGLSVARNTGLESSEGCYVAFIDDDCIAEPGYVEALIRAFEESNADAVAGKVTTVLPEGLVTDLPRGFDAAKKVAHLDLGTNRRWMASHEYALGCNLAVRRSLALEVGGFRTDLGYSGKSKVVGEDTEFWDRLRAAGAAMAWEPRAAVIHRVGPERFTKAALRNAAYCYGRKLGKRRGFGRRARAGIASLIQVVLTAAAWPVASWSPRVRFELELKLMERLGKVAAALRPHGGGAAR